MAQEVFYGESGNYENSQTLKTTIENCYCAASVSNHSGAGAFFGKQDYGTITFNECYFDKSVSGIQTTTGTAVGKTTTQMQTQNTFLKWSNDIWKIEQGKYPELNFDYYAIYEEKV